MLTPIKSKLNTHQLKLVGCDFGISGLKVHNRWGLRKKPACGTSESRTQIPKKIGAKAGGLNLKMDTDLPPISWTPGKENSSSTRQFVA